MSKEPRLEQVIHIDLTEPYYATHDFEDVVTILPMSGKRFVSHVCKSCGENIEEVEGECDGVE